MIKPENQVSLPTQLPAGPRFTIPLRFRDRRRVTMLITLLILGYVTLITLPTMIPDHFKLVEAITGFTENIKIMFLQPHLSNTSWLSLLGGLGQSILLAFFDNIDWLSTRLFPCISKYSAVCAHSTCAWHSKLHGGYPCDSNRPVGLNLQCCVWPWC